MPRSAPPEPAEETQVVEAIPEQVRMTQAQDAQRSMVDKMRDKLAKQPKRTVKVRNDSDVFVQINGYSFLIQPNVKVAVPEQVAEMLDEAGYI